MRYINYLLLVIFIVASSFLLYSAGMDYLQSLQPKIVGMSVEASGIKVAIDNGTSWTTVSQTLVVLLGSYFGIKIINKYIK